MNRLTRAVACAALPAVMLAGCADWLTGTGISDDPNRPTEANANLLLVGVTAAQTTLQTGGLARATTMWVQQFAGTDRQYITLDRYGLSEADFDPEFSQVYLGGGLVDIRQIQDLAQADNDQRMLGIAQVWEALTVGTAASVWGAIPYSQAVDETIETPQLDPQPEVYAAVQALLTQAISSLQAGDDGLLASDLIYRGDTDAWIEAAYTLKARYYMHWAQAQLEGNAAANTACGGDCLTNAIAATANGISDPANDFRLPAASTQGQENIWHQFMFRERDSYMRLGATLVNLLNARNDARRENWLAQPFVGTAPATPGGTTLNPLGRGGAGFRQPIITYGENMLLRAEAQALSGAAGDAETTMATYRTTAGVTGTPQGGSTLERVYEELYIALFQNVEAWNMYKRSCYPNVALAPTPLFEYIPRRVYYGSSERNANPNIPAPGTYPLFTTFDHAGGTLVPAGSCIGMPTGSGGA